jgi:hypothetical protein
MQNGAQEAERWERGIEVKTYNDICSRGAAEAQLWS